MLSSVGRTFQRTKIIKPLSRTQRLKVYTSCEVNAQKRKGSPKFSPFNTVSRQSRNSYLLRVTKQPNVNGNYQPLFDIVLPLNRRSTIDVAKFERIIGDVKTQNFEVPLTEKTPKRCRHSVSQQNKNKPLTARDCHTWRKNFHHYDFSKQSQTLLEKDMKKKMEATNATFSEEVFRQTIQSNFNNYNRFKLKPAPQKSHKFESDFPHQYLKGVGDQQSPQYNILAQNQQIIRPSMIHPKGEKRFFKYRQKIATRFDRVDQNWNTVLQYNPEEKNKYNTIDFNQILDRQPNSPHSTYPIRLSLSKIIPRQQR